MKKEIEIKVSRGAFGNPYYKVSVYDTERLVNLHRFWYTYGSAGEDLANVFRMLRLAGHGDALDRLAHALKMSDPEYNKCATEKMVSREVEFKDQWFEKHDKMPTYTDAIEWGRYQAMKAVEECAELTAALMHFFADRARLEDLITEIADVQIMCEQLALMFGQAEVEREKQRKLERMKERLIGQTHT